ncbi:MAG: aldo/keto reductase, partial [Acidimicrobiales bacterium]
RDSVVLATKVHGQMKPGAGGSAQVDDPNRQGNSRRWITYEVDQSLRRLQTDYIDLYQIHRPDPRTDVGETLSVLSDLVHSGKIRAFGSSTFPAEEIVEGQWTAERRGLERFTCEQPPYSLLARGVETGVLPTCERYGMGVIAWSPLAGGWLTGRYRKGQDVDMSMGRAQRIPARFDPSMAANQRKLEVVEDLARLAEEEGVSFTHLSIAFVIAHPAVTAAIIGPRTMEQLDDLLAGSKVALSDDILDRLDQIVPPGVTMNAADAGWEPPSIAQAWRRRRPQALRAAAAAGESAGT